MLTNRYIVFTKTDATKVAIYCTLKTFSAQAYYINIENPWIELIVQKYRLLL